MGMTGMIQHIWRTEGLAGFFKGFGSSLACHVTYSFLWWACYSTTRRQVAHFFPSLPANHTILYDAVTGILAGGLRKEYSMLCCVRDFSFSFITHCCPATIAIL